MKNMYNVQITQGISSAPLKSDSNIQKKLLFASSKANKMKML